MHFKPKISTSNGGQENNNQHTRIRINDYEIDEVKETKVLVVTIDNKLTWLPHLKLLAKKLRCCSGQLNRIKISCPHTYTKTCNTPYLKVTLAMPYLYGVEYQKQCATGSKMLTGPDLNHFGRNRTGTGPDYKPENVNRI